jgi:hypothetical protein
MSEEKKETKEAKEIKKERQIILETDGNNIKVVKAEVAGSIEFVGILENILKQIRK